MPPTVVFSPVLVYSPFAASLPEHAVTVKVVGKASEEPPDSLPPPSYVMVAVKPMAFAASPLSQEDPDFIL